ncbi:MAG TPA: hypothetical protein PKE69_25430, partial [Pyrinomonadaceae bacterium]|nr:hypothetical protein [Pyrinomonadaceae bacterium]
FYRDGVGYHNVNVTNLESAKIISSYKFSDFNNLFYLTLPASFIGENRFEKLFITKNYSTGRYDIRYRYSSNEKVWGNRLDYLSFYANYSRYIAELNYTQSEIVKNLKLPNLKPRVGSLSNKSFGFEVIFSVNSFRKKIIDEIRNYLNILNYYHEEALRNFETNVRFESRSSITSVFIFPLEIKEYCEQYLLYFGRFLQDLGLNATSSLKEEVGKVLFSITPTDDVEALDKIREALAVYLKLPESPIVYDDSFAAMRLQQQIENLQHSQRMAVREIRSGEKELRLAQTVIEQQDKIIVQKDTLIEQQNKVIEKIQGKSIMIDSLENKAEFEKVFDGLEFGESKELKEKLGIKFNLVTSLKTLGKKLIGKDDEIISLDLERDT